MVNDCCFTYDAGCGKCQRCGFLLCNAKPPIRRRCDVQPNPGLGDMVAAGLSAIGITKERVSAVVGGDCGCAKRQEALNALGRRVGIG
jgi:hypothetical protein